MAEKCEKLNLVTEIESKIKNTQDSYEAQVKYLTEVRNSVSKLKLEEEKTVQQIAVLTGSFNAYQDILKGLRDANNNVSVE